MSSINLTRQEAEHRSRIVHPQHYDIHLDFSDASNLDNPYFESISTVVFDVREPGSTFIDLRAHKVNEVRLDGKDIRSSA